METGIPLTDADRWDWLIQLRDEALSTLQQQQQQQQQQQHAEGPAPPPAGVVVTCSALKRKYRDVLRVAAYHHPDVRVRFVFLRVDEAALVERVRARRDHYMKDFMVRSQLETLEVPGGEERDVWTVDASGTGEVVRALAREVVRREMGV
jgi:gluconokinase